MKSERRGLVVVVAVLLVSAVLGGIYGPNVRATTASADDYQTAVRDFTRVLNVVQNNYADTVDIDKAVYQGAIPGMLRMLDPHSSFFDAKQFSLLREDQRGKYYGVGMIVAPRENHTVVMAKPNGLTDTIFKPFRIDQITKAISSPKPPPLQLPTAVET